VRDFRGWLWQEGRCIEAAAASPAARARSFLSVRLPVEVFRDALIAKSAQWPPPDLDRMTVRLRLLAPGDAHRCSTATHRARRLPFSLEDLRSLLLPGEQLTVQRAGSPRPLFELTGAAPDDQPISPWIAQVIRRLPVDGFDAPMQAREVVDTSLGRHELVLTGDIRSINQALAAVATRLAWTVGAMLLAVGFTWGLIELFVIRRITLLTERRRGGVARHARRRRPRAAWTCRTCAAATSSACWPGPEGPAAARERRRAPRADPREAGAGHVARGRPRDHVAAAVADGAARRRDDPSARYISRMQQAVRVLYGQASPSEAFESTTLALERWTSTPSSATWRQCRLHRHRAVEYAPLGKPLPVRADEHSLEDVVTHVLRNADRHRTPAHRSASRSLPTRRACSCRCTTRARIPEDSLERIFEYGVSDAPDAAARAAAGRAVRRATYMSKMGGTIVARNEADGVAFVLTLPRA
jgi:hypothetical protein